MSHGFDLNWEVSQGFSHKALMFSIYVGNLFDVVRFRLSSVLVYFGVTQRYLLFCANSIEKSDLCPCWMKAGCRFLCVFTDIINHSF